MATYRVSIFGSLIPDSSGNVYYDNYANIASNDVWKHQPLVFKDTSTRDIAYGLFNVPKNYVGTAKVYPVWTTTATSGNCIWDFDYRTVGGDDTTSLDQSGVEEALTVTDAAPGAAHRRLTPSMTFTAANLAADETVEFLIARDGASSDTIAASVMLHDLIFEWADV